MSADQIQWIAADWGTSNLRCWALSSEGRVVARAESGKGMAILASGGGDPEAALLELIQPWLQNGLVTPVVACGMVGARGGWFEVPYDTVPCSPRTSLTKVPTKCREIDVSIHAGVRQDDPADVMRGEETQVAGLLSKRPGFEGIICLPGTHSKWVKVAGGRIQRFRTYLTGEMFRLLSEQSVLNLTIAIDGWDQGAFCEGVLACMKTPEKMLSQCFGLRAEALLSDLDGVVARSRLSGILVGVELAGATGEFDMEEVVIIGSTGSVDVYEAGLAVAGLRTETQDAEEVTILGMGGGAESIL